MKRTIAATAFALATAAASSALATTYTITIPGTITATSNNPPVSVGDAITLSTTIDDNYVVAWGNTGYMVAGSELQLGAGPASVLPLSGPLNWSVVLDGFTNNAADYAAGFEPWYREGTFFNPTRELSGVAIVFNGSGVFGVDEFRLEDVEGPNPPNPPIFYTGGGDLPQEPFPGASTPGNFASLPLGSAFGGTFLNGSNIFAPPTFQGVWNLSAATITVSGAVPEPSTWAMMIAGLGLVGAGMRMRRRAPAVRCA